MTEAARRLDGRVYTFPSNIGGVMPMILQSVHNNFSTGLTRAAFDLLEDGALLVELAEGEETHRFVLAEDCYSPGTVCQRGDTYAIRTAAQAASLEGDGLQINAVVHFIETPFTRLIQFVFTQDKLKITFDESPSIRDASEMMLELTGISRAQVVRNLMPLLKRDRMQHTLRTFTTVSVQGTL